MKPSRGRIVDYWTHGTPNPSVWPAIVQEVNPDGSLNLFVFGARGHILVALAKQGRGVGEWSWPVREPEPAAAPAATA